MSSEAFHSNTPTQTILVIDDDPGTLLLAEEVFSHQGLNVYTASCGEDALAQVLTIKPDIILLDIMMPGIDGFETCRQIKMIRGFENTPIIMLTGRDDVAAVDRAFEAGAWDFTSKPINWPILRHRVRYSLRASEAFSSEHKAAWLSKTLDKSSNEIIVFSEDGLRIQSANASALSNLGYSHNLLEQLAFSDIAADTSHDNLERRLAPLATQQQISLNLELKRRNGSTYPVDGIALYNTEQDNNAYICIFQDVTERRKTEKQLHQLAYYDDLTGLPNRRLFKDHVASALTLAKRNETACAVCILDLDGFKSVNDALGHSKGDLLLKQVSDRLASEIRQHDTLARVTDEQVPDTVNLELARLGGDEFLLLLTNFEDDAVPARVADRILKTVSVPYNLHGQELNVTASIGIAFYPDDGDTLDVLMQHADNAMYTAKNAGKNNYAYYSRQKGMSSLGRLTMETQLRKALQRDELELYYQPQVNGLTGEVIGAEALVRWNHPDQGLLSPQKFIPLAEETGLINPIGDWVLNTAVVQGRLWNEMYGASFKCAVNVSGIQLRNDGFLDLSRELLAPQKGQQSSFVLELTESSIMTSNQSRIDWLHELQALGVEIAIDDFGTGYSSLAYLKKLPIDYLKIDRSFVVDLAGDKDDQVIVSAIFLMAQALGLNIVVEGVETCEQLQLVKAMGDCLVQGYLYSAPVPVAALEAFVTARNNGRRVPGSTAPETLSSSILRS